MWCARQRQGATQAPGFKLRQLHAQTRQVGSSAGMRSPLLFLQMVCGVLRRQMHVQHCAAQTHGQLTPHAQQMTECLP